MSLTNPNTVVTEQRLNDFYKGILPYLGGMPEMVANKFSRADLYSTTEKVVGCWTDGKPIYQKTINCGNLNKQASKTINHNISNIDTVISCKGFWRQESGSAMYGGEVPIAKTNLYLYCYASKTSVALDTDGANSGFSETNITIYVTIQYTKTTDTANSFKYANENDYSTSEKIVGTWIDGKPIYQKTFDCGALPNNTTKQVAHGINNFYMIIQAFGTAHRTSDNACLVLPCIRGKGAGTVEAVVAQNISIDVDETFIYFTTAYNWSAITDKSYVTLQYIKTTD